MCTKFQAAILKKRLSFAVWNAQKATFYTIYEDFATFPIFKFCPIWAVQKIVQGSFFAFLTKIWPKNMYCTTQAQIFKFDLFWNFDFR